MRYDKVGILSSTRARRNTHEIPNPRTPVARSWWRARKRSEVPYAVEREIGKNESSVFDERARESCTRITAAVAKCETSERVHRLHPRAIAAQRKLKMEAGLAREIKRRSIRAKLRLSSLVVGGIRSCIVYNK